MTYEGSSTKMNISQTGDTFIRIGPQGSDLGNEWDDGCFDGVREILIWHGGQINAIQFVYDYNGTLVLSDKHGGNGGTNFDHIQLDYPSEYLTEINGFFRNPFGTPTIMESLKFSSNRRSFAPFGCSKDSSSSIENMYNSGGANVFHFKVMANKLCGFFGHSSADYLHAIGIHFRALPKNCPKTPETGFSKFRLQ